MWTNLTVLSLLLLAVGGVASLIVLATAAWIAHRERACGCEWCVPEPIVDGVAQFVDRYGADGQDFALWARELDS